MVDLEQPHLRRDHGRVAGATTTVRGWRDRRLRRVTDDRRPLTAPEPWPDSASAGGHTAPGAGGDHPRRQQPVGTNLLGQLLEMRPASSSSSAELAEGTKRAAASSWPAWPAAGARPTDLAPYVERFVLEANEAVARPGTLAIVAYKQPISGPGGLDPGVNVDGVMRTLQQRGTSEVGRPRSGQAIMFGTTPRFLEALGIDSLDSCHPRRLRPRRVGRRAARRGLRPGPRPSRAHRFGEPDGTARRGGHGGRGGPGPPT